MLLVMYLVAIAWIICSSLVAPTLKLLCFCMCTVLKGVTYHMSDAYIIAGITMVESSCLIRRKTPCCFGYSPELLHLFGGACCYS